jgi:hypothetical protein
MMGLPQLSIHQIWHMALACIRPGPQTETAAQQGLGSPGVSSRLQHCN